MAIEVASLMATIGMDTSDAEAGARKVENLLGGLAKGFVALGAAAGVGLALRAAFKELAADVRMAAEEQVGIVSLGQAIRNTGANWAMASAEIETYLAAEAKRVSLDDGIGRTSIQKLTEATHDYRSALALMPLAIDLARARHMDLASAAEVVGRVAAGNVGILTRYGIAMEKGATATQALTAMQATFAGQGEAFAQTQIGQWERLQVAIGNLRETAGSAADQGLTRLYSALATLAENALPYVEAGVDAIIDVLNTLGQAGANAFYWGANIVQQFAAGLGSGTSYIASVLTSIGDMISYWLSSGSPPRLLPELDTWGQDAAQTYLDAFGKAKPKVGMNGLAEQFAPLGVGRDPRFANEIIAHERFVENLGKRKKEKEKRDRSQERADKAANAKAAEMEAKRLHDAELQYSLATADTAGQIAIMTRELNGVAKGSAEYYSILTRLVGLQKTEANEAKQLNAAKIQWELAQADKAGQIAIWKRELAAVTEGTQEWYDISTKIIQLQKGGGGGGGAGAPANLDKFKEEMERRRQEILASMPKIQWEDVWAFGKFGTMELQPGLKSKLKLFGEKIWAEVSAGFIGAAEGKFTKPILELLGMSPTDANTMAVAIDGLTKSWAGLLQTMGLSEGGDGYLPPKDTLLDWQKWALTIDQVTSAFDWLNTAIGTVEDTIAKLRFPQSLIDLLTGKGYMTPPAAAPQTIPPAGAGGLAAGYDGIVTRPTVFLAGEAGPERVTVTPRGKGGGHTINITINAPGGDPRKVQRAVISGLAAAGLKA